jgi:hypothetical protein
MLEVKITCDGCGKVLPHIERFMTVVLGQIQMNGHTIVAKEAITGTSGTNEYYHACEMPCVELIATQRNKPLPVIDDDTHDIRVIEPMKSDKFQ